MANLDYLYTCICFISSKNNTFLKTGGLVSHIEAMDIFKMLLENTGKFWINRHGNKTAADNIQESQDSLDR
jgi:hypothetical protein